MLEYNQITERKYIVLDGDPYEVLSSHVSRKQQRKPVNVTKLKHLITGKVIERSFHVSEKVEKADMSTRKIKYLYNNKGQYWFCEKDDPSQRFNLSEELVGPQAQFMKQNSLVDALEFNEEIIGIEIPIKVDLKVVDAPPAVKGDTAKGGTKQIELETGATINAPLFITEGEVVRINTVKGEYVERAGATF